jgi:uncharacterized protein (TIGR04255 family)
MPVLFARSRQTSYSFASLDGQYRVGLTPEFCGISTSTYTRWEQFSAMCERPLAALQAIYTPAVLARLGLRYRNVIVRSKLGLEGIPWRELLQPHSLGELGVVDIGDRCEEMFRHLVIRFPDSDQLFVRLEHGFVQQGDSKETCYLIDADFFAVQPQIGNEHTLLEKFHGLAHAVFRWTISDRLHNALGPDLAQ